MMGLGFLTSQRRTSMVNNYIHGILWFVNNHTCPNFKAVEQNRGWSLGMAEWLDRTYNVDIVTYPRHKFDAGLAEESFECRYVFVNAKFT